MKATSSYESVAQWLADIRAEACWIPMPDLAAISITGEDAEKFLQGQLTNDVRQCSNHRWQAGAACTPKGRMVATFRLLRTDEGFVAVSTREGAQALKEHLTKYILFFKAEMRPEDASVPCYQISNNELEETTEVKAKNMLCGHIEPWRRLVLMPKEQLDMFAPDVRLRSANDGFALDIQAGFPHLFDTTRETFLPHEAGLTRIGGVSFQKGCYTGQEIVARMEYRGKLKQHVHLVSATPPIGESLNGTPIVAQNHADNEASKVGRWIHAINLEGAFTFGLATLQDAVLSALPMTLENGSILHLEDGIEAAHQQGESKHES